MVRPAREQFELKPADFEEGVANRIEDAPARAAVAVRWPGVEFQVLADAGKRERRRCASDQALHVPTRRTLFTHSKAPPFYAVSRYVALHASSSLVRRVFGI